MGYYVNLNENTLSVPAEQVMPFAKALVKEDKATYDKFDTPFKVIEEYFSWIGWDVVLDAKGNIGTIVEDSAKLSYDEWDELENGKWTKFLVGYVMLIGQDGDGMTYDTYEPSDYYQKTRAEMDVEQLINVIISKVNSSEELEEFIGTIVDNSVKNKILEQYKK